MVYGSESSHPGGRGGGVDTWDSQTGLYLTTTWQVVFIGTRIFALDDNRQSGFVVRIRAALEYASGIWEPLCQPRLPLKQYVIS